MKHHVAGGDASAPRPGARLSTFLAPESVKLDLAAGSKDEALEELIALLPIKDPAQRIALELLRQREAVGSTGIGMGVAIPHCRSATFARLMVAFARSEKGVMYQSVDRKKVRLFFLIVSPPVEITSLYHPVLAAIVNLTKEDHNRKRLLEAESAAEVRTIFSETIS
jgi:PTS system nitrogen regulatory IIA component